MNPRDGLAQIRDALDLYHVLKTLRCLGDASICPGWNVSRGQS